jgi:hypothetical protein
MTRALLIVTMEPAAGQEEEFNDWYDTEHFPQRSKLPLFESASRWVCLDGWPRYIAVYDMASMKAVTTPEYNAVSGPNSTPWSKRVLSRTIGRLRHVGVAVGEQAALQCEAPAATRLLGAGYNCAPADAVAFAGELRAAAAKLANVVQTRVFAVEQKGNTHVWLFVAFDTPVTRAEVGALAKIGGRGAATFNLYAPYYRMSGY